MFYIFKEILYNNRTIIDKLLSKIFHVSNYKLLSLNYCFKVIIILFYDVMYVCINICMYKYMYLCSHNIRIKNKNFFLKIISHFEIHLHI